jgi:hypothetical protein
MVWVVERCYESMRTQFAVDTFPGRIDGNICVDRPVGSLCYENGHTHSSRFEQCYIWLYCALYVNRSQVHAAAKHRVHVLIRLARTYNVPVHGTQYMVRTMYRSHTTRTRSIINSLGPMREGVAECRQLPTRWCAMCQQY